MDTCRLVVDRKHGCKDAFEIRGFLEARDLLIREYLCYGSRD